MHVVSADGNGCHGHFLTMAHRGHAAFFCFFFVVVVVVVVVDRAIKSSYRVINEKLSCDKSNIIT